MEKVFLRVVIPTYNRSRCIEGLLHRLDLASKDPRVEIVVVDDFSRPEERQSLRLLSERYREVRFEFLSENSGGGGARNAGAFIGDAEWVWFFDDDDVLLSDTVLSAANSLQAECKNDSLVFLSARFISGENVNRVIPCGKEIFNKFSRFGSEVNTSCTIFKFWLFKQLNGWDERLVAGQDADLLLRAAELTDAAVLAHLVVDVVQNGKDRITTNPRKQMLGKLQFLKKNYKRLSFGRNARYLATLIIFYPYLRWLLKI